LGPKAPPARVAIEACREAWYVHAKLTEWNNDVLLVDTTRSRQMGIGQHRRKTDRIDAEVLARSLERGGIPVAHLLSPHRQELRRQLGVRRALVETRSQYVTTTRGLVREQGKKLPSGDTRYFLDRVRKTKLDEKIQKVIEPLLATIELVNVQLAEVDRVLDRLSQMEPVVSLLTTAPGVGPIVAATFVSVIDDAKRFRRAHQVEAYLGLVASENTTGGKRRLGSITKHGNSYLRSLLVQAGWNIMRLADSDDPLRRWGHALAKRRGKRIAVVALARRLAGVLWAIWRDGTVYDTDLASRTSARGLKAAARQIENQAVALQDAAAAKHRHPTRSGHTREVTRSP
jgi:transposase